MIKIKDFQIKVELLIMLSEAILETKTRKNTDFSLLKMLIFGLSFFFALILMFLQVSH